MSAFSKREKEELRSMIDDDIDSHASEEQKPEKPKISQELKEHVTKYFEIDGVLTEKNKEVKTLKDARKPHEEFIKKYLSDNPIGDIQISNGSKITLNKSETKTAINVDIIRETLTELNIKKESIDDVLDLIDNKRDIKNNVNLKVITQNKPQKKQNTKQK